jgi:hypothetical protein
MGLPERVRVKLSSEAAGAISLTPVVVQEMTPAELIGHMLGVTGKDERRILELLLRGTMVSGASRFRWPGWEADTESLRAVLAAFPDPEPARPFARERCLRAVLHGSRAAMEIPRAAGERKGLLRRTSFWDRLMEVVAAADVQYAGYSYRDHADRYRRELSTGESGRLREAGDLLRFSSLRDRLRSGPWTAIELYVER